MITAETLVARWHTSEGEKLAAEFTRAFQITDPEQGERVLISLSQSHDPSNDVVRRPVIDVRGIGLNNLTIRNMDLQRIDFSFSSIIKCAFINIDFLNADFSYCELRDCVFENCMFDTANFAYAQAHGCAFRNSTIQQSADMYFTDYTYCTFEGTSVSAEVKSAAFDNCYFSDLVIRAKGNLISFSKCRFKNTLLEEDQKSPEWRLDDSDTTGLTINKAVQE